MRTTSRLPSARPCRLLLLAGLTAVILAGTASAAIAGDDVCIGEEDCEEPCPLVLCDTDADCPTGEVCVESSPVCCASSYCVCDPQTGEWACTGDCVIGVLFCVSADPADPADPFCVPAVSTAGAVLLALLLAGIGTATMRRRHRAD